ncbi:MAG: class I SAM-dependent methyltransferase [Polyangiales bacterium]
MNAVSAQFYDALHSGQRWRFGLLFFQGARLWKRAELGCGSGRLLSGMARNSAHVVGIDCESALLELAQRTSESSTAPPFFLGDMRNLSMLGSKNVQSHRDHAMESTVCWAMTMYFVSPGAKTSEQ